MADYWNHNSAYHRWVLRQAGRRRRVLDVGCGEGLLLQRLAATSGAVVGIDPHAASVARAQRRVAALPHVEAVQGDFATYPAQGFFDLITFVASIHHMDARAALAKARALLIPGGRLLVVGLAANRTWRDWAVAGASVIPVRVAGRLHRETVDIGVPATGPDHDLAQVRRITAKEIPGARIRRGLYYRYLLRWDRPTT